MNKAIFWDFDGTLAKAPFLWSGSIKDALDVILSDSQITLEEVRNYTKAGFTWDSPEKDYSELIGDLWWEYMLQYFNNIYLKLGLHRDLAKEASLLAADNVRDVKRYQLYEDTITTLEASKASGYKNYLLSNHIPELKDIANSLGIASCFEGFIISSLVGYDKPRTEIFEYAKKLADYPEICYMVGDNPHADIEGGKAVNMTTILVHKAVASVADYTCEELSDVIGVITRSN